MLRLGCEDAAGGDSDGAERLTERTVHPARYDAENGCVLCEAPEIMRSKPGTVAIRVSVAVDGVNLNLLAVMWCTAYRNKKVRVRKNVI